VEEEREEGTLRELQEELSKLRDLRGHNGYRYLMEIAAAQVETRRNFERSPLKSLDATLEQEFQKGEIAGILLFSEIVDIRVTDLEEQIKTLTEVEEDENVSEDTDD
jgi:hypothetical protein